MYRSSVIRFLHLNLLGSSNLNSLNHRLVVNAPNKTVKKLAPYNLLRAAKEKQLSLIMFIRIVETLP